ncbi:Uncharacterized protein APZ42_031347 [Daphnia magna]|uniref:Reverse transcriptase domain-containing protein n=1 Tax=Daphnia magna TaxID=35525 RepID=A0A164MXI8_9CRUS|nr:Uncharacterized protein APZ42_031347 [Daphnia magna]
MKKTCKNGGATPVAKLDGETKSICLARDGQGSSSVFRVPEMAVTTVKNTMLSRQTSLVIVGQLKGSFPYVSPNTAFIFTPVENLPTGVYIEELIGKYREMEPSGYWQIQVHDPDIEKTAFVVENYLYEFKRMAFGLFNAPATFQRLMNYVLRDVLGSKALVYLDDVIIFSDTFENHLRDIREIFTLLNEANLKLKLNKYRELQNANGPLRIAGYYRRFITHFGSIAKPLTRLTHKDLSRKPFAWGTEEQAAFEKFRASLVTPPVLVYPNFNDACVYGIGAVLSQMQNGQEHPIVYSSRPLTKAEMKYNASPQTFKSVSDYVGNLADHLRYNFQRVREESEKARNRQPEQYNKRTKERKYVVGDRVLLDIRVVKEGDSRKLTSKYKGPYRVVKVHTNNTVDIADNSYTEDCPSIENPLDFVNRFRKSIATQTTDIFKNEIGPDIDNPDDTFDSDALPFDTNFSTQEIDQRKLSQENVAVSSHQNTENQLPSAEICADATSQRHPTPISDDNSTPDTNESENPLTESKDGSLYYNYKRFFSMVLLAICDANYRFTLVDFGTYGRENDRSVYNFSTLKKQFVTNSLGLPLPSRLPDTNPSDYPEMPYGVVADNAFRQEVARRTIENAFGIMAAHWRVFLKPIPCHPKNVKNVVLAGVVLHSFLSVADSKYADASYGDRYQNGRLSAGQWRQDISERERLTCCFQDIAPKLGQNASHAAKDVRDYQRKYFNNEGIVPWQEKFFGKRNIRSKGSLLRFISGADGILRRVATEMSWCLFPALLDLMICVDSRCVLERPSSSSDRGGICSLPFTTELSFRSLDGLYLLIEPITKYDTIVGRVMKSMMTYECGRIKEDKVAFRTSTICDIVIDGVWEVHKSMTRDTVESKIKNWLRHCPRYAFKNNEDEKINGEDEFRQEYNKRVKMFEYQRGDNVLLDVRTVKSGTSRKLNPRYQGPKPSDKNQSEPHSGDTDNTRDGPAASSHKPNQTIASSYDLEGRPLQPMNSLGSNKWSLEGSPHVQGSWLQFSTDYLINCRLEEMVLETECSDYVISSPIGDIPASANGSFVHNLVTTVWGQFVERIPKMPSQAMKMSNGIAEEIRALQCKIRETAHKNAFATTQYNGWLAASYLNLPNCMKLQPTGKDVAVLQCTPRIVIFSTAITDCGPQPKVRNSTISVEGWELTEYRECYWHSDFHAQSYKNGTLEPIVPSVSIKGTKLINALSYEVDNTLGTILQLHPALKQNPLSPAEAMTDILATVNGHSTNDIRLAR